MSIEIKELVIRASVGAANTSGDNSDDEESGGGRASGDTDRAAIVRAAVAEVLRILKASKER